MRTWTIRIGVMAGFLLLLSAVYALAYSVPAAGCHPNAPCDGPAPNHPHAQLALWLAVGGVATFIATAGAAHFLNQRIVGDANGCVSLVAGAEQADGLARPRRRRVCGHLRTLHTRPSLDGG